MDENVSTGFTLIELLITLAIIIILATIALPGMVSLYNVYKMDNARNVIWTEMAKAKSIALKTNQTITVNFAATNLTYTYQTPAGSNVTVTRELSSDFPGTTLSLGSGATNLTFSSNGTAGADNVVVTTGTANKTISVYWAGRIVAN